MNYRQRLSQGIHCLVTIIDIFYKQYLYSGHAETFFLARYSTYYIKYPKLFKVILSIKKNHN